MEKTSQEKAKSSVCLLVVKAVEKSPEDYRKSKYCHDSMHEKNYVVKGKVRVSPELVRQVEQGNSEAIDELANYLREHGITGKVSIKRALGGPGRRAACETKEHWLSKRQSGMPTIARLNVNAGQDEEAVEFEYMEED